MRSLLVLLLNNNSNARFRLFVEPKYSKVFSKKCSLPAVFPILLLFFKFKQLKEEPTIYLLTSLERPLLLVNNNSILQAVKS